MRSFFFKVLLVIGVLLPLGNFALAGQACVGYTSLVRNGGFDDWPVPYNPPTDWSTQVFGGGSIGQDSVNYLSAPYSASVSTNDFGQLATFSQAFTSTDTLHYKFWQYGIPTYEKFIRTPCLLITSDPDLTSSTIYFYDFVSSTWNNANTNDIARGLNCGVWNFTPESSFERMDYPLFTGLPSAYGSSTYVNVAAIVPLGATSFDNVEYGSCDQVVTTTDIMLTSTTTDQIASLSQDTSILVIIVMVGVFILGIDLVRRSLKFGGR